MELQSHWNSSTETYYVIGETLGEAMGVPAQQRHRLRIPHLAPIGLVHSPRFGWYADLDEPTESACFQAFFHPLPVRQP